MDDLNQSLKQALTVAGENPAEALALLEAGLQIARRRADWSGVSKLARHAGLVATHSGDLHGAIRYYDEALRAALDDAYLHYAIGDVYRTLGQNEQARLAFTQSLELATGQGDAEMIQMAAQARAGCPIGPP